MRSNNRLIEIQVLNKSNATNIILRCTDNLTYEDQGRIDFKYTAVQIGDEQIRVKLYDETEPHHIDNIHYYFIFLNSIDDIKDPQVQLQSNGKLRVPAPEAGVNKTRFIDSNQNYVWVIGNDNFNEEQKEQAQAYAKKNGLVYAGECNLKNNKDIYTTIQNLTEEILKLEIQNAVTKAATAGALSAGELSSVLPPEIGQHIGSFLTGKTAKRDGGRLRQVSKSADEAAKNEENNAKDIFKPKKGR